ncbi:MAG: OmpA family protein [Bacteroidota bacterium]
MRGIPLVIALLLLLWLLGGAWWLGTNYEAGRLSCLGTPTTTSSTKITKKTTSTTDPAPTVDPAVSNDVPNAALPSAVSTGNALTIADGNAFRQIAKEGLYFDISGADANIPNSTQLTFQKLQQYLSTQPDKILQVQGCFRASEVNSTEFLSLGMARAADIKDTLVALGVKAAQIELDDSRIDDLNVANNRVLNGVRFSFTKKVVAESETALATLRKRVEVNPAILYFVTNGTNVEVSPAANQNIQSLKTYLNSVPSAKVAVTGHTDNVGKRASNLKLSSARAEQVKRYLIRKGFRAAQLQASGKGPDEAAATNKTAEGRAKNRRVEIKLAKN